MSIENFPFRIFPIHYRINISVIPHISSLIAKVTGNLGKIRPQGTESIKQEDKMKNKWHQTTKALEGWLIYFLAPVSCHKVVSAGPLMHMDTLLEIPFIYTMVQTKSLAMAGIEILKVSFIGSFKG